jgi:hypothetical protein
MISNIHIGGQRKTRAAGYGSALAVRLRGYELQEGTIPE